MENFVYINVTLINLKAQLAAFVQQRDSFQTNLNQVIGAIYACELMIQKHQEQDIANAQEQGDKQDGEADNESTQSDSNE